MNKNLLKKVGGYVTGFALAGMLSLGSAHATPMAGGVTSGPDSSFFPINMTFTNNSTSGESITNVVMDGSTATAFPILWDFVGIVTVDPGIVTGGISGEDTQVLTFFGITGWTPGLSYFLEFVDPDGDPGPEGVS